MKAKTIHGSSTDEIKKALENNLSGGYSPTLAFVFISIKQDRQAIADLLHAHTIDIIGATSSGEFVNGHQGDGGISILLLDINKENYAIYFTAIENKTVAEAATAMAKDAMQKFKHPAFIVCSTLIAVTGKMFPGETLLRSIEQTAGADVSIFGGMAGDDISFSGTYVFTHDQSTDYGMVTLVLNEEKIALHGMAMSGWKPIGVSRTITKSVDNLIYTIDGQPALEMYLRFLGTDTSSTFNQVDFFNSVGVHYPFQIEREGRTPMICNPVGYDLEQAALVCEANVLEGSTFRFSSPPDFDIVETVIGEAAALKNKTQAEAEALLIFSCAGRLNALGPLAHEENEGLYNVWKAPMAGFYTYGEYGRATNGKHELHSTTCCWVTLKEK